MPLPTARVQHPNDTLTRTHIYPDRFRVTLTYNIAPLNSIAVFTSLLRVNGFTQPSPRSPFGRKFEHPGLGRPIHVSARFIQAARTAYFTAHLSPLANLRDGELDYAGEYSRPHQDVPRTPRNNENWLHPTQVDETTPDSVLAHLWAQINAVEHDVYNIACSLVTAGPFAGNAVLIAKKLSGVELCVDLTTPAPYYHLRRFAPRFRARYDHVIATRYGPSARGYSELMGDFNLIHGYRAAGQKMKAYEKTSERLRLELAANKHALRTLLALTAAERQQYQRECRRVYPSDPREFHDEDDFTFLCSRLTNIAVAEFNAIRGSEPEPDDHGSIFDFVARSASVLSRHHAAQLERALRVLTLEGRLTARTLTTPALLRLTNAGVLRRSTPDIYVPVPRFQRALRTLRMLDGRWQGQMRAEVRQ